jgi:hypothetical protein
MTDLQFIELANRWISDTQVKIKAEVGANNQQAQVLKNLIVSYRNQIDSMLIPNVDKQVRMSRTDRNYSLAIFIDHHVERHSRNVSTDYSHELRKSAVLEMSE